MLVAADIGVEYCVNGARNPCRTWRSRTSRRPAPFRCAGTAMHSRSSSGWRSMKPVCARPTLAYASAIATLDRVCGHRIGLEYSHARLRDAELDCRSVLKLVADHRENAAFVFRDGSVTGQFPGISACGTRSPSASAQIGRLNDAICCRSMVDEQAGRHLPAGVRKTRQQIGELGLDQFEFLHAQPLEDDARQLDVAAGDPAIDCRDS